MLRKDDKVRSLVYKPKLSSAHKAIKIGMEGVVLATRHFPPDPPEVLVKFKGRTWPKSLNEDEVEPLP